MHRVSILYATTDKDTGNEKEFKQANDKKNIEQQTIRDLYHHRSIRKTLTHEHHHIQSVQLNICPAQNNVEKNYLIEQK